MRGPQDEPARPGRAAPAAYFAYGSNMAPEAMAAWCPEHRVAGVARLAGFRLAFTRRSIRWGAGAADIVADPRGAVWGVLYELPESALFALDEKEGQRVGYRRVPVEVELAAGGAAPAVAYEVVTKSDTEIPPRREYMALLVGAARARGLPEDYVAWLEAAPQRIGVGPAP